MDKSPDRTVWRARGEPLVAGSPDGPLSGRTVAIKDLFAVAGYAVGAGNPAWLSAARVEPAHAAAVQALLDAGADVTGIVQTDEFAYSLAGTNIHYGTPPNPAAADRIPGGSSNGPASAVAQGLVDVGLGTDTGGSIRVPASYCALYGIRPTHGVIPATGVLPLAPSFDTVGWLTRDTATLAEVADVLLPRGDSARVERLVLAEDLFALADPAARPALTDAAEALAGRLDLPADRLPAVCDGQNERWREAFRIVQAAQAWESHGRWLEHRLDTLDPDIAQRFADGRAVTAGQRTEAERVLVEARRLLRSRIVPGTALIQPAAVTLAPPRDLSDADKAWMRAANVRLTCLASLAGLPAVAVPAVSVEGCPVGLCLVGAPGSDAALVNLATRLA
ncbi:MAG: amidase [Nocardioidaceae bacterium]